jgi:hypothetical protein
MTIRARLPSRIDLVPSGAESDIVSGAPKIVGPPAAYVMRRNPFCCSLRARRSGSHHYENDSTFPNRSVCAHPAGDCLHARKRRKPRPRNARSLQRNFLSMRSSRANYRGSFKPRTAKWLPQQWESETVHKKFTQL